MGTSTLFLTEGQYILYIATWYTSATSISAGQTIFAVGSATGAAYSEDHNGSSAQTSLNTFIEFEQAPSSQATLNTLPYDYTRQIIRVSQPSTSVTGASFPCMSMLPQFNITYTGGGNLVAFICYCQRIPDLSDNGMGAIFPIANANATIAENLPDDVMALLRASVDQPNEDRCKIKSLVVNRMQRGGFTRERVIEVLKNWKLYLIFDPGEFDVVQEAEDRKESEAQKIALLSHRSVGSKSATPSKWFSSPAA
jgi:hypothetical protein